LGPFAFKTDLQTEANKLLEQLLGTADQELINHLFGLDASCIIRAEMMIEDREDDSQVESEEDRFNVQSNPNNSINKYELHSLPSPMGLPYFSLQPMLHLLQH
jgi:hypothetical protein